MLTSIVNPTGFISNNLLPEDGRASLYWPLSIASNEMFIASSPHFLCNFCYIPTNAKATKEGIQRVFLPTSVMSFTVFYMHRMDVNLSCWLSLWLGSDLMFKTKVEFDSEESITDTGYIMIPTPPMNVNVGWNSLILLREILDTSEEREDMCLVYANYGPCNVPISSNKAK